MKVKEILWKKLSMKSLLDDNNLKFGIIYIKI